MRAASVARRPDATSEYPCGPVSTLAPATVICQRPGFGAAMRTPSTLFLTSATLPLARDSLIAALAFPPGPTIGDSVVKSLPRYFVPSGAVTVRSRLFTSTGEPAGSAGDGA